MGRDCGSRGARPDGRTLSDMTKQPPKIIERGVTSVAAQLRNARDMARGCTILIGAGCSASAGIPLAADLIQRIKEMDPAWSLDEERAGRKFTYGEWMDLLGPDHRHTFLASYIDRAKINWAHICLASLMAGGYVNRILTTNFDPLLVQSCALFGEFPAVYDFAVSQFLKPHMIPAKALFYLHGQRSGFVLKNTPEELKKHARFLKPIIDDSLLGRLWIVVGYSGLSDPVFDLLSGIDVFDYGLYWIGYKDQDPAEHVMQNLLTVTEKRTYLVRGYDADDFFDALIRELKIYPPKLVAQPFTHLNDFFNRVTPEEKFKATRQMIQKAIEQFEQMTVVVQDAGEHRSTGFVDEVPRLMNAGDYDGVIRMRHKYDEAPSPAGADYLSRAYMLKGKDFAAKAKTASSAVAEGLFAQAFKQYRTALAVRPDFIEVLNLWGISLYDQANKQEDDDAVKTLDEEVQVLTRAIDLNPNYSEALLNRAVALSELAVLKKGRQSSALAKRAMEDFSAALASKPSSGKTLAKWGDALRKLASVQPRKAATLLKQAEKKYQESLKLKSNASALIGWGEILWLKSETEDDAAADELVDKAMAKFEQADLIQPGSSAYYSARHKAISGDEWGCRESLQRAKHFNKLPSREYILKDLAFVGVRDADWFKELLEPTP